jgi:hypothetical protein
MLKLLTSLFGIVAAALYVGYLAAAIGSASLWIIVAGTFALMIREFVVELRSDANGSGPAPGASAGQRREP